MPLNRGKGKAAFESNLRTEMDAGKSKAQSLAIAYAMQRKAKAKRMAEGGMLTPERLEADKAQAREDLEVSTPKPMQMTDQMDTEPTREPAGSFSDALKAAKAKKYAEGGMADDDGCVDRIMASRYSRGGMAANDETLSADELPNEFDDLALNDDLESTYTAENSGDLDGGLPDEDDDIARMLRNRRR